MSIKTEGVNILLGDPKKAIFKLSIPMIIAMLISQSYNLVDSFWVTGLGLDALAATGFISPLISALIGISSGLGVGATAAISRYIGSEDKAQVDNAAFHTLILIIIISALTTILGIIFLKPLLLILKAGSVIDLTYQYGVIYVLGSFFIVFINTSYGILRAEGNIKKVTYAMIMGAILNIILDPLFIYYFYLGVSGAAYASILSLVIVSIFLVKWFRDDTYINFSYKFFNFSKEILKRLLLVGLPAGTEVFIFSLITIIFNVLLMMVAGIQSVAIYSAGWRVLMFAAIPFFAISSSIVPVIASSYGAEKFYNFLTIRDYAMKLETIVISVVSILIFIFADQIATIFIYFNSNPDFFNGLVIFLRIMSFFILFKPLSSVSASILQGLGRGFDSLILILIREFFFNVVFAYVLAVVLQIGENGIWIGMVIGNIIGGLLSFLYSQKLIKNFLTQ
jgi:putative MATE family efflux protein